MTYGLNIRAPSENRLASQSRVAADQPWRALTSECRLAVVEEALRPPTNDLIDAYPLAL